MSIYVFDTSSPSVLGNYFPERFPSFWSQFNHLIAQGTVVSVREVRNELRNRAPNDALSKWVEQKPLLSTDV